jgi:fructosamine-3-kinase
LIDELFDTELMCNRVCRTRDNARSRDAAIAGEVESTDLARIHLTATGAAIGWHTENLIKNAGFSREERDQWAAITTTFRRGITSGTFRRGNCQPLKEKSGDIRFDKDEPHGGIHPWRR